MTKIIVVNRDYYAGSHASYRSQIHDSGDVRLDADDVIAGLLADVADGDEVEIETKKTGRRPFGDRRYIYQEPHTYGPETDEQMQQRLDKETK